jgi:hypothetical protein
MFARLAQVTPVRQDAMTLDRCSSEVRHKTIAMEAIRVAKSALIVDDSKLARIGKAVAAVCPDWERAEASATSVTLNDLERDKVAITEGARMQ